MPKILIIIVTWNKKEYLNNLLLSISNIKYPKECLTIVIVDNASTDGTVQFIKTRYSYVKILQNDENLGGTGGFNRGLDYAFSLPDDSYDYIWLLDNDVVVHPNCLRVLVNILESRPDAAIAGSTMMQMTSPYRINEIGAKVDLHHGRLLLRRHGEEVSLWKGRSLAELLQDDTLDLSEAIDNCPQVEEVDYVAAASLLVRGHAAKKAGLWSDFFIHFDDVEWCLRIKKFGYKILASSNSLIWHVPGDFKIPTWILYYDTRNLLYLIAKHGSRKGLYNVRLWIIRRAIYYYLLGKNDLACLLLQGVSDYDQNVKGKADIVLDTCYFSHDDLQNILHKYRIKKILIPWTVDSSAFHLVDALSAYVHESDDISVEYLFSSCNKKNTFALPGFASAADWILPVERVGKIRYLLKNKMRYDLVIQSEYNLLKSLILVGKKQLYVNYDNMSLRSVPSLQNFMRFIVRCSLKCFSNPVNYA